MIQILSVSLLLVTSLLAAPQFDDDTHHFDEEAEGADAPIAWSEEDATTKHLDLEDPISWSASTEVLDENHAWYRRRRSVDEVSRVDAAEDKAEGAGVISANPALLMNSRKLALLECRERRREFSTWRSKIHYHIPTTNRCNSYCCYPVSKGV